MRTSVGYALIAAALFGLSTPLARMLVADVSPVLLAGLLYLGSGVGLSVTRLIRDRGWRSPGLSRADWPWLLGAIATGGLLGPVALMIGLSRTTGASASLLLNLEAVFTALLAWLVFRENAGRRVVAGMAAIVAGGAVLSWNGGESSASPGTGPLWVAAACACWAVDNNLTRRVSSGDPVFIAASKGLIAGSVNTALALALGARWPEPATLGAAMAVGLLGYGTSLVLFVLALRGLGTARTGAYFSTAPFLGAAASFVLLDEPSAPGFWLAGALMGLGVWLHVTEQHSHRHRHGAMEHTHGHVHDAHHQHTHDFPWDGREPHEHPHRHAPVEHSHRHVPDIHHRHEH